MHGFLALLGGIPSHDTFSRLFRLLDPKAFEPGFGRFVGALAARIEQVVAIDGNTARRSFDRRAGSSPLHLISAGPASSGSCWASAGSTGTATKSRRSPRFSAMLALEGCTVTADAMHCQKATAQAILDRGGDYVQALKRNQPVLLDDVRLMPDDLGAAPDDIAHSVDGDHGRIEVRRAEIVHDVVWLASANDWPGLKAVGKIAASREIGGQTTAGIRYYLLSNHLPAARLAKIVRAHWQIENRLLWVLDVGLKGSRAGEPCPSATLRSQSHPRQRRSMFYPW